MQSCDYSVLQWTEMTDTARVWIFRHQVCRQVQFDTTC